MATTIRQTIILKGDVSEGLKSYISAANNILPGMLLQLDINSSAILNAEAAKRAEVLVAIEDDFLGMSITGSRPDTTNLGYMIGDLARCKLFRRGEVVNMILKAGQVVTGAQYLTSNADGKLKTAGATDYWMFKAVEAADATAGDVRVVAEVL